MDENSRAARPRKWAGQKYQKDPQLSAILPLGRKTGEKIREFSLFSDNGLLAAIRLEPAAMQSIPTETDLWISRIYREFLGGWYTGGVKNS
ncbi:MAG: hypothetical protein ACLQU4_11195 [Limisphaerales bacterium]